MVGSHPPLPATPPFPSLPQLKKSARRLSPPPSPPASQRQRPILPRPRDDSWSPPTPSPPAPSRLSPSRSPTYLASAFRFFGAFRGRSPSQGWCSKDGGFCRSLTCKEINMAISCWTGERGKRETRISYPNMVNPKLSIICIFKILNSYKTHI